jgi:flagellar basal-body rod protein FlgB
MQRSLAAGAVMHSMALFDLASRQSQWLAERQSVIAGNIANANTPGYKARDLVNFEGALEAAQTGSLPLNTNHSAHFDTVGATNRHIETKSEKQGDVLHSGNDVSLEQEFLKSGETMKTFNLNIQIVKAFNRMLFAATKV